MSSPGINPATSGGLRPGQHGSSTRPGAPRFPSRSRDDGGATHPKLIHSQASSTQQSPNTFREHRPPTQQMAIAVALKGLQRDFVIPAALHRLVAALIACVDTAVRQRATRTLRRFRVSAGLAGRHQHQQRSNEGIRPPQPIGPGASWPKHQPLRPD